MSTFDISLQKYVYNTLNASAELEAIVGENIFDYVPPNIGQDGDPKMPFVVIGEDTMLDASDKCGNLKDPVVTIHLWSEAETKLQLKTMMQIIHDLLQFGSGEIDGMRITNIEHQQTNTMQEAEGVIFHGVMQFKFYMEG